MHPSVISAHDEAEGYSCTNQLLIGLIEEDGVVGLCVLAVAQHIRIYPEAPTKRKRALTYRHLGCCRLACVVFGCSGSSAEVTVQLRSVRCAGRAEQRGVTKPPHQRVPARGASPSIFLLTAAIPPKPRSSYLNSTPIHTETLCIVGKAIGMSDYEDEMDVDAPAVDSSITFGGDQKKGKRSAANLPVEAEDSLPW